MKYFFARRPDYCLTTRPTSAAPSFEVSLRLLFACLTPSWLRTDLTVPFLLALMSVKVFSVFKCHCSDKQTLPMDLYYILWLPELLLFELVSDWFSFCSWECYDLAGLKLLLIYALMQPLENWLVSACHLWKGTFESSEIFPVEPLFSFQ